MAKSSFSNLWIACAAIVVALTLGAYASSKAFVYFDSLWGLVVIVPFLVGASFALAWGHRSWEQTLDPAVRIAREAAFDFYDSIINEWKNVLNNARVLSPEETQRLFKRQRSIAKFLLQSPDSREAQLLREAPSREEMVNALNAAVRGSELMIEKLREIENSLINEVTLTIHEKSYYLKQLEKLQKCAEDLRNRARQSASVKPLT